MALADLRETLARYLPDYYHRSESISDRSRSHRAVGGLSQ
jgi:hypothetical protein